MIEKFKLGEAEIKADIEFYKPSLLIARIHTAKKEYYGINELIYEKRFFRGVVVRDAIFKDIIIAKLYFETKFAREAFLGLANKELFLIPVAIKYLQEKIKIKQKEIKCNKETLSMLQKAYKEMTQQEKEEVK